MPIARFVPARLWKLPGRVRVAVSRPGFVATVRSRAIVCVVGVAALQLANALHASQAQAARRQIGGDDGLLAFGVMGPVTAGESLIAIVDRLECQVALVRTRDNSLLRRIGGCGRGPGELVRIDAITFKGDTVLVAEQRTLHFLHLRGSTIRKQGLQLGPYALQITSMGLIDDSTAVVAIGLPSLEVLRKVTDPAAHEYLRVVDLRTGLTLRSFVHDSLIGPSNQAPGWTRDLPMCSSPHPSGGARVVTLNPWTFELTQYHLTRDDVSVQSSHLTKVDGLTGPDEHSGRRRVGLASTACSSFGVFAKWSRSDGGRRSGVLLVDEYLHGRRPIVRFGPTDSLFFGTAVAAWGSEVFLRSNELRDWPVLTGLDLRASAR